MATLERVREGFQRTWASISEGWSRLTDAAAHAITRFTPGQNAAGDAGQDLARRNVGWGLLPVEVFDEGERVEVRLEAPGLERDDFEVEVIDDQLRIGGEKRVERQHREGEYHVAECAYGHFSRLIPLPVPVKPESARARYRNGVLEVTLEKSDGHRRRRIEVQAG